MAGRISIKTHYVLWHATDVTRGQARCDSSEAFTLLSRMKVGFITAYLYKNVVSLAPKLLLRKRALTIKAISTTRYAVDSLKKNEHTGTVSGPLPAYFPQCSPPRQRCSYTGVVQNHCAFDQRSRTLFSVPVKQTTRWATAE